MKFLFLAGSFHQNSRSLAILKNIENLFSGHEVSTPNLENLPFYSPDLAQNKPPEVISFLAELKNTDGILCCTPEYNHSIPAVLKNAIDWASRPAFESVLKDMPVTIITQADSPVGGARAQAHLKLILDSTLFKIHMCHEMMITSVSLIFDQNMQIIDDKVISRLERHINDFKSFTLDQQR